MRKFEGNSFKYDSERCNNVGTSFKFVSSTDRVKHKSKVQTNGSQPEAHAKEKITSSSSTICNISNNQLEISNIGKVVDNDIQKCKFVVLETVVKTDL